MENVKTFFRMYGQLNEILTKQERRKAIMIAFLSIISALLETLGVGVILPFIMAMLQPQQLLEYESVAYFLNAFGMVSSAQIVIFVGITVVIVYVIKNTFILAFNKFKLYFRNSLERDLSVKMLKSYIHRPYTFFLNANSSEVMRGINGDNSAVATVVDNYCTLFNEGLTCLMLGVMLIILNPIMALGIIMLAGVIVLAMVLALRKKISEYSEKAREAFADRYQYSYECINGIKEIDVMKRQDLFLNKFANASYKASEYNTAYLWIAMLPSRLIETIFIGGLVLIVIISYVSASDISVIAAQLSALGVAAVRILPSISNLSNAMNSLVFQRPALESAYSNLVVNDIKSTNLDYKAFADDMKETEKVSFKDNLAIDNIVWRYSEDQECVLNNLSMCIKRGEAIGVVGESGAGKTTLVDIILGLLIPQEGHIEVDGNSIYEDKTQWHKMIGYVPQSVFLIDDTIRNNILFGISEEDADEERLSRVVEQAQLTEFVKAQKDGLNTVLGERGIRISGGQRQRIAIARALYYDPEILTFPSFTSYTLSHFSIVVSLCAIMISVFVPCKAFIASITDASVSLSSAEVASSKTNISGS